MASHPRSVTNFEEWQRDYALERLGGALVDKVLIDEIGWSWELLLRKAKQEFNADFIYEKLSKKEDNVVVFGKKANNVLVIGYNPRSNMDMHVGVLSNANARKIDQWMKGDDLCANKSDGVERAVNATYNILTSNVSDTMDNKP
ncbi:hypothetical protein IAQ61_004038 [Plenodomus lingam]|uniref:Predicted protein n=1 Tax=Leptosphaeria maculans (strain JN3 / isolate v23.1.3 / race Av1-4-5-6-7-8) TaxID=985895 RepID=E4ZX02_LEPMJ|nr:predicted protein [Plenodomus lingam JN3]KAH9873415.1 hypothetical protein IAQ61_004038 [Plenodomus lingam]CBX95212.1 predicted protein [Plenodomus lingam JN3]